MEEDDFFNRPTLLRALITPDATVLIDFALFLPAVELDRAIDLIIDRLTDLKNNKPLLSETKQ